MFQLMIPNALIVKQESSSYLLCRAVIAWKSVARAWYDAEELRQRIDEVEYLRHEEQQHSL